ncbi:hypothetical protein CsSME_00052476 [Camellia sinensis var. sinensis]
MDGLMSMVVVGVVAAVMVQSGAAQTVYVVGDSLNWTVPLNDTQAYSSWASNKNFTVGDILTFNFPTNQHNVLQVSNDSYNSCNSANPIGNTITTGPANITLSFSGENYYICTVGTHCQLGQKLAVTVSATAGTTTATPPPPPPPPTSSSSVPVFDSFFLTVLCVVAMAFFL